MLKVWFMTCCMNFGAVYNVRYTAAMHVVQAFGALNYVEFRAVMHHMGCMASHAPYPEPRWIQD